MLHRAKTGCLQQKFAPVELQFRRIENRKEGSRGRVREAEIEVERTEKHWGFPTFKARLSSHLSTENKRIDAASHPQIQIFVHAAQ